MRLSLIFLLSTIVTISSCCIACLLDGGLWMKLLSVPSVNAGDGAVGVYQQNLAANAVHHHKTATRLVAEDAAGDQSLFGILFYSPRRSTFSSVVTESIELSLASSSGEPDILHLSTPASRPLRHMATCAVARVGHPFKARH